MKAITLLSGGKDSFLATLIAIEQGFNVTSSVGVLPDEFSEMFHFQNASLSENVAGLLNLKHKFVKENEFPESIKRIAEEENAEALISGAIASNYQKTRIEAMCTELGIISYTPLWLLDQNLELSAVISAGIKAILISVSAEGLSERHIGRLMDEKLISDLNELFIKYRINVAGEGGEYESLVIEFMNQNLNIKRYHDRKVGSMLMRIVDEVE